MKTNVITTISLNAFRQCASLERITIPQSVTKIETTSFTECSSLTFFDVSDENSVFSKDINGILYDKYYTKIICYPIGITNTQFEIPNTVISIESYSFYSSKLTNIVIPNSVTTISMYSFYNCVFTNIIIPESVTSIGMYSFGNCSNLKCIYFTGYKAPTTVSNEAFSSTSVTTVMTSNLYDGSTFGLLSVNKETPIEQCEQYSWPTLTFTKSNTFSKSNIFSQSNTFSNSNTFIQSNTYTKSNTLTKSDKFTQSNTNSQSNTFSNSNTLLTSEQFNGTYTLIFTESITLTIVPKTIYINSLTLSKFGSLYSYVNTSFVYYDYTVIQYSLYVSYYSGFYTLNYNDNNEINDKKSNNLIIIISVCVAVVVIIIIIVVVVIFVHKNKKISTEIDHENMNNETTDISMNNAMNFSNVDEDPFAEDFKENDFFQKMDNKRNSYLFELVTFH